MVAQVLAHVWEGDKRRDAERGKDGGITYARVLEDVWGVDDAGREDELFRCCQGLGFDLREV